MILEKKKYGYSDMVTLSFKVTPFYSLLFAVQRIVSALLPTVSIFITAHFINTAMEILNKTADISAIYVPIILLASVMVYNGVDLSGGQWQRITIARGLYRVHNTVVLDEPTAAIDPIEESRIYKKFMEIAKGKTAIIVTHRLGSVKIADRVVVMDKGKIVAVGSHDELMKKCDLYRSMFNSQAEWYSHKSVSSNHESLINAG